MHICNSEENLLFDIKSTDKIQPTGIPTRVISSDLPEPHFSANDIPNEIIFEDSVIHKYEKVYQGTKDDTVELNINFKTMLVNYFKELMFAKELNEV